MRDIGKNIRSIRISRGMTQDALAEQLFVTRQTVSNYENGRSRPDIEMVLKIAEVLGTDANAVIYGVPVSEDRRNARRKMIVVTLALVILGVAYLLVRTLLSYEELEHNPMPGYLNQLVMIPPIMLMLGWALVQGISMISRVKPLSKTWVKGPRKVVVVFVGLMLLIPVPYIVWIAVCVFRDFTNDSVAMFFPRIPVYDEIAKWVMKLVIRVPAIYSILGGLLWVVGFPEMPSQ